jgi:hypothetical protein
MADPMRHFFGPLLAVVTPMRQATANDAFGASYRVKLANPIRHSAVDTSILAIPIRHGVGEALAPGATSGERGRPCRSSGAPDATTAGFLT